MKKLLAVRNQLWAALSIALGATLIIILSAWGTPDRAADSPLAEWRGFGHRQVEDDAIYLAEFSQRQALIDRCMKAKGQSYVRQVVTIDPDANTLTIAGHDELVFRNQGDEEDYNIALHGEPNQQIVTVNLDRNEDGTVSYEETFGYGCSGDAHREILGVYAARAVLTEQLNELWLEINKSPAIAAAEIEWLKCIEARGYKARSRVQFLSSVEGQPDSKLGDAVKECDKSYSSVRLEEMRRVEAEFVEANREALEKYGVQAN